MEISLQMVSAISQRLEMTTTITTKKMNSSDENGNNRSRSRSRQPQSAQKGVAQQRVPPPVCHAARHIYVCLFAPVSLHVRLCVCVCMCVRVLLLLLQSSIRRPSRQAWLARGIKSERARSTFSYAVKRRHSSTFLRVGVVYPFLHTHF